MAHRYPLFKSLHRHVNRLYYVNGYATFKYRDIFMEFMKT